MEKEEKKKRKGKGHIVLVTILIVLLLIAFLGIGFAIGSQKTANLVIKEAKEETNKVENLSIYDDRIANALLSFEQLGLAPEEVYEFKVTDLTKKDLILTALKGLEQNQINYCTDNLTIGITTEDLNKSLNKVVQNGKVTIEDIQNNANKTTSYSVGGYGYSFKYKDGTKEEYALKITDNKIYIVGPCGHEGPNETVIKSQTVKAEKTDDNLYVYQKVAFGKTEYEATENGLVYYYYKDKEYQTKVEIKALDDEPTWEEFNTYKITFTKSGDKYYFVSSELEK